MTVPEELRLRLSRWCADRIEGSEREHRRIGYTINGSDVVITDRRAPQFPELGAEWTSTALARLRPRAQGSGWVLYRPAGDGWLPDGSGDDPIALLESVAGSTPQNL